MRAARVGDRKACQAIWEKYAALVQRMVRRFFGPGPDHPDVCQEAFLRVFKRLNELREPAALPGFIIGITLGVARNEARRRRIRALVGLTGSDEWPGASVPGAADEAREAVRSTLRAALPFLDEHLQIVDSPHDGLPLYDYRSGARREIDRERT